jgi:hypothetical protein
MYVYVFVLLVLTAAGETITGKIINCIPYMKWLHQRHTGRSGTMVSSLARRWASIMVSRWHTLVGMEHSNCTLVYVYNEVWTWSRASTSSPCTRMSFYMNRFISNIYIVYLCRRLSKSSRRAKINKIRWWCRGCIPSHASDHRVRVANILHWTTPSCSTRLRRYSTSRSMWIKYLI